MCTPSRRARRALYAPVPPSSSENMVPLALTKPATFPATRAKGRVPRGALPCARGRRYASCTNKAARHRPGGEVHMPTYIVKAGYTQPTLFEIQDLLDLDRSRGEPWGIGIHTVRGKLLEVLKKLPVEH